MRRRQITIEGGRYLIFYSFDDGPGPDAAPHGAPASDSDDTADARADGDSQPTRRSAVEPSAEDERRV